MDSALVQTGNYLWSQSIQIGLLVAIVALIGRLLSRRSAHLRYLLWLVVVAKCLVPPVIHVAVPVLPREGPGPLSRRLEQRNDAVGRGIGLETPAATDSREPTALRAEAQSSRRLRAAVSGREAMVLAWLAGLVLFLATVSIKAGRMARWLSKKRREAPTQVILRRLESLDVARPPRVWLVDGASQPFVWGLWRGDIYLPAAFDQLSGEHQRDVLAHELCHVLRFDAGINLLQVVAQAIFWFHPLVWWANSKVRQEREKCCDEIAIARLGAQPKSYSRAIVATLLTKHGSNTMVPSLAIAGPTKNIEERIKTMLRPGKRFYRQPSLVGASCALTLALLTVPTSLALTARPAKAADKPATASTADTENEQASQRELSADKMRQLALSLILYATEHEKKYPTAIGELTPYYSEERADELLTFAITEVEYLAAGKTSPDTNAVSMPLAFDVTLLRVADGTNVAFADGHVDFIRKDRLAMYGIAIPESHLGIVDVQFEPIHQGKNVVHVTAKNTSDMEQILAGHIYTRSPDYGPSGIGWGTSGYFDTLQAGETKSVRWVFKIQGPVTERTYVNLRFSNPTTQESYDSKWCFQDRKYTSAELPKAEASQATREPASAAEAEAITQAFNQIQRYILDKQYEQAWERFSKDYQMAEYQRLGFVAFRRAMEPTHPMHSAFTWERNDFLSLKPGQVYKTDGALSLAATVDGRAWTIDFVREDDQWKIDWIAGYIPAVIRMQEEAAAEPR